MASTNQGVFRLGRVAGIELYLHWSWFIVALIEVKQRVGSYTSPAWNVLEYLALFLIVLLHEFGHSLACRQVGGQADRIVLWPLGGIAYVSPPQRPGATLWSIAAGPLVNVALAPVLFLMGMVATVSGVFALSPDVYELWKAVLAIDVVLLVFNLLPIYPLDGGQILRSLLWFLFGPAWSLMVASAVGILGFAGLALLALAERSPWLGVMAAFILLNCWNGLRHSVQLLRWARRPRQQGLACPVCGTAPAVGALGSCGRCREPFDAFESRGICPHCGVAHVGVRCPDCGKDSLIDAWSPASEPPSADARAPALPEP